MVRYAILGPVELRDGERRVAVGGPRQVALLAMLLVNADRAVTGDRLIEAVWHDQAPAGALKRLQVAIARLRRIVDRDGTEDGSALQTVVGGYLLAVRPGELDAEVFQTAVDEGRCALQAGEPGRARDALRDALAMWRGPALGRTAYEEFAQPEARRLEELRVAAIEMRAECELQLGEHGELVGELEMLVAGHPGRERLAAQLMLALYRCDRQADALDVYARTRAYLSGELGLEPGPALRSLQAEILAHSPTLQPAAVGAPAAIAEAVTLSAADDTGARRVRTPAVVLPLAGSLRGAPSVAFVGRDVELARLRERWKDAAAGRRAAVIVGGEAGIGKTRLARELACTVHGEGALVLYGRCDEGLAVPYQPFVEALRPYVRAIGRERLHAELGDLAAPLAHLLPELGGLGKPPHSDPKSERFALFEAMAALVEAMTRHQPALLILDDLHWAARPTLLLMRHLVRCDRPLRLLVVGSYRETDLDAGHPLGPLLADLQRDASAERLSLGGLGEPAVSALLQASLGHPLDERDATFVQLLQDQTAGNPFFIRELLAHLTESGVILPPGEHAGASVTAARLVIPEGLRQVIGHRVARLSTDTQSTLRVAAVAGPTFSFALLEHVLGEPSGLLDALDQAVAAGLVTDAGQAEYAFAHALVRETIYRELGSARRMRLHRQLGEALEALGAGDAHVEGLAHHFACAAADGQSEKAADYALAAGHDAASRLGYEEAAAHYERGLHALTLSAQADDQRRCVLLLALGAARWGVGEADAARQAYREATELADKLADVTALARAALGFDGPYPFQVVAAMNEPIVGFLERALAALGEGDSSLRAQLLGHLAAHTDQRASELAREALRMAHGVADEATLADVLTSCLWATRGPDALHESVAMIRELRRVANALGHGRREAMAHVWLLDFLLELGDIDGFERELEALQRLAEARNDRYVSWLLMTRRVNHALLCGRLDDCERFAHDVLAHDFEGPEATTMIFAAQMCYVRGQQGRLDELIEEVEGFVEDYDHPQLPGWRCALAYMYAELGRTAQARLQLDVLACADFADLPRDAFWLTNLSMISATVAILDDAARARLLHPMLLPYADRCMVAVGVPCSGSASRPLGLLATTLGWYDEAERHFERAVAMNTQIRSPLWAAHAQHDYARMLLLRNHRWDRDKALHLLTEAMATAVQLGLTALADKARPLMLTAEAA
ncbi:MAG: ATP-binding protein [Solirubrobacteraceae bacterium]